MIDWLPIPAGPFAWGAVLPDATRAAFAQPIGAPSPAGLHPAGAAPCGALDMAGNVYGWPADGAARGGPYLSGPDELRCSARLPMHPAARDPHVGFRVVAVEPRGASDRIEVPAGKYAIGRDPASPRLVDVAAFELGRAPAPGPTAGCRARARSRARGLAWARCTTRSHSRPRRRQSHIGFRVASGGA